MWTLPYLDIQHGRWPDALDLGIAAEHFHREHDDLVEAVNLHVNGALNRAHTGSHDAPIRRAVDPT